MFIFSRSTIIIHLTTKRFAYQTYVTDAELTAIALKMEPNNVETFAKRYLRIPSTQIANTKFSRERDPNGFKSEILELWRNGYRGHNARVVGVICDSFIIQCEISIWFDVYV